MQGINVIAIIASSGPVVMTVLFSLLLASIVTWAIVLHKRNEFKRLNNLDGDFLLLYKDSTSLKDVYTKVEGKSFSPLKRVFETGYLELVKTKKALANSNDSRLLYAHYKEYGMGSIERSLKKGFNDANHKMSRNISILASIGSISPFVGLFGTVWGIIHSFTGLASGGGTLESVAPGIAEALVTTAVGLVAAIPAVWFYNHFSGKIQDVNTKIDTFSLEFINTVERTLINN